MPEWVLGHRPREQCCGHTVLVISTSRRIVTFDVHRIRCVYTDTLFQQPVVQRTAMEPPTLKTSRSHDCVYRYTLPTTSGSKNSNGTTHAKSIQVTRLTTSPFDNDTEETRIMRGTDCWTDHQMLRSKIRLHKPHLVAQKPDIIQVCNIDHNIW